MSNAQGKKRAGSIKKSSKDWNAPKKKKFFAGASNIVSVAQKRSFGANGANSVVKISKTLYPVPDALVTKVKTSQTLILTTAVGGGLSSSRLLPNSLNDPFGTAGAVQPRFFDQLMAMYTTYCVYGAKVAVKVLRSTIDTANANETARVLGLPSVATTFPMTSLYADANEFPKTIRFDINNYNNAMSPMMLTDAQEKMTYFDIPQFFGRDRANYMAEQLFEGTASTDPTQVMSYYLAIQSFEADAGATHSVAVEVTMTQYAVFRAVVNPTTSS